MKTLVVQRMPSPDPPRRSWGQSIWNWVIATAIITGLCGTLVLGSQLESLPRIEHLIGPPTDAAIMSLVGWITTALVIWVVAALACGITKARRRKGGQSEGRNRRPCQFSLRSLWVVMVLCAVVCGLLKTLPVGLAVYLVFCSLVFVITIVSISLLAVVIDNLIVLMESALLRLGWLKPPSEENTGLEEV